MKVGKYIWQEAEFTVFLSSPNCFIMPKNSRAIGKKLIKWIARNVIAITRHDSFSVDNKTMSCQFEGFEITANLPLDLHHLTVRVDFSKNVVQLTMEVVM